MFISSYNIVGLDVNFLQLSNSYCSAIFDQELKHRFFRRSKYLSKTYCYLSGMVRSNIIDFCLFMYLGFTQSSHALNANGSKAIGMLLADRVSWFCRCEVRHIKRNSRQLGSFEQSSGRVISFTSPTTSGPIVVSGFRRSMTVTLGPYIFTLG